QVASSAQWTSKTASFTDVYMFGEVGLYGAGRTAEGTPVPIMQGTQGTPRDVPGTSSAGGTFLTPKGTLAMRGAMVPVPAYAPPPAGVFLVSQPPRDYADTGYVARLDRATGAICIIAPPVGIVSVGGYRFLAHDLQEWAKRLG